MVKRICPKCNMEFNRKSCYDRHINIKIKSNILYELNQNKT